MQQWNDKALDGLEERVDDCENELTPLRSLPDRVADHAKRLDELAVVPAEVGVLTERVGNMIDAFRAIRNALYAAAGGFVLLFLGVILKVGQ